MEASKIVQQCNTVLTESNNKTVDERLYEFFNAVTDELTKWMPSTTDFNLVNKIVATLISIDVNHICKQTQLINHRLLVIIRDYMIQSLFKHELSELTYNISVFFNKIYNGYTITDEMVQLFVYKPLVDEMCKFLNEIEKYAATIKLIETMKCLLEIFQRIQMTRFHSQKNLLLEQLFIATTKCIMSNTFIEKLEHVGRIMSESNVLETFLFDTCVEFMYWQPYEYSESQKKHLSTICESLLNKTVHLMSSSSVSEAAIRFASLLSLNVIVMNNDSEENIIDENYYSLADHCISILGQPISIMATRDLLSILCHLAFSIDIVAHMKNNSSLKPILLKLSECDNSEISFNAYRLLSLIMNEEDIKKLTNGDKIVSIYYLYFISMIDDPVQRTAFHSLLYALKSLVQHDDIKVELIKQEMILLLVRCVVEESFQNTRYQQYALEILLALSFNKEAITVLKQNKDFMTHLKAFEQSTNENLRRAANNLRWQFDQNSHQLSTVKAESSCSSSKFDIMLSYCHSDKTLCFQIYEALVKDGMRVWLDRDQMHGDFMAAMANAIENSEFVLICMSEAYKLSPYCQIEAYYAFQRQCKIIPLTMKAKFRPDGWLGIIVTGKIYVDFTKYQFDSAYSILKTEIERKRTPPIESSSAVNTTKQLVASKHEVSTQKQQVAIDLPTCVDSWSADHVRSFLIGNNFISLLSVFPDFDGTLLHKTYWMCQSGCESMFQALRTEVMADTSVPPLTLATYFRFLQELKRYIPLQNSEASTRKSSIVCNVA